MKDLRDAITGVLKEHPGIEFHFCRLGKYEAVLDAIAERFLKRGRQDLNRIWMWECFEHSTASAAPEDVPAELQKRLHPDETYWFLASEEDGRYWVAEASGAAIPEVIGEMPAFEYYVINCRMTWMLCENRQGVLFEARARFQGRPIPIA